MQIKPPQPIDVQSPSRRPAVSLKVLMAAVVIILLLTVIVWLTLWAGGVEKASKADEPVPAAQAN